MNNQKQLEPKDASVETVTNILENLKLGIMKHKTAVEECGKFVEICNILQFSVEALKLRVEEQKADANRKSSADNTEEHSEVSLNESDIDDLSNPF